MSTNAAVLKQREELGVRGFAFGPNLGTLDYSDLFRSPDDWADLRDRLSAFKVYGENVWETTDAKVLDRIGPNTYDSLTNVGVFQKLHEWGLPLHLEMGAVKPWEKVKGEDLRLSVPKMVDRVDEAGGKVALISMDEPLRSMVRKDGEPVEKDLGLRLWEVDQVGELARLTANFCRDVTRRGSAVALIEAYPHHPAERIRGFLLDLLNGLDDRGVTLAFFELDIDLWGIRDQRLDKKVPSDLRLLRDLCRERGIPFRVIATATRAESPPEYRQKTLELTQLVKRVASPVDGVTVQSWVEQHPRLPANLPATDDLSHLSVLAAVMDEGPCDESDPRSRA
jgi:hypothetical protein